MADEIGGGRTSFRMQDIISVGTGGGTVVHEADNIIEVVPESVGHELVNEGVIFGGDTLTATDIAVGTGLAKIPNTDETSLDTSLCIKAHEKIMQEVEIAIDRMKTRDRKSTRLNSSHVAISY